MPQPQPPIPAHPAVFPIALLAAWVLPGLGHFVLGLRARAAVICVTLMALFTAGVLVGGIDVVDSRRDTLWYAGQVLIGPTAIAVDRLHRRYDIDPDRTTHDGRPVYVDVWQPDDPDRKYTTSIGRVNEIGTLYCSLAGVLNLLVILDVFARLSRDDEAEAAAKAKAKPKPAGDAAPAKGAAA